jgi:hypothetical protein
MSFSDLWKSSGTKMLGYGLSGVGAAAAAFTAVDPALVTAIAGPKYGAYFALAAAIVGGFVAKRGHKNTADIAAAQNEQFLSSTPGMPSMTTNVGSSP